MIRADIKSAEESKMKRRRFIETAIAAIGAAVMSVPDLPRKPQIDKIQAMVLFINKISTCLCGVCQGWTVGPTKCTETRMTILSVIEN